MDIGYMYIHVYIYYRSRHWYTTSTATSTTSAGVGVVHEVLSECTYRPDKYISLSLSLYVCIYIYMYHIHVSLSLSLCLCIHMYIYIYIYIYIVRVGWSASVLPRACFVPDPEQAPRARRSENNFAICFLLEIPLRGFPFQMRLYETCRIPKTITRILNFKGLHLKRRCPHRDLKQDSYRKHPVLEGCRGDASGRVLASAAPPPRELKSSLEHAPGVKAGNLYLTSTLHAHHTWIYAYIYIYIYMYAYIWMCIYV